MLTNNYISLKHLSNLEDVDFGSPPSQTLYNDMCYLTRLTELTFTVTKNVLENNPTALERLPLKCLTFQKQVISYQLWNLLSRLQDLESLYVWRVNSERIIESFSVLTNLTGLTMKRTRKTKGIHLSKLTNLQVLQFASQPARKYYKKGRHDLREKIPRLVVKDFMS
jgi:Leucine-rich repeat (LRR) protein